MKRYLAYLFVMIVIGACADADTAPQSETEQGTLFYGATVWSEGALTENAKLHVVNGRIHQMTSGGIDAEPVDSVNLEDKFIIPGLINAHGHVGTADGLESGPGIHSEENVQDQLELYARYGITTVVSLGGEPPQAFDVRDRQREEPTHSDGARLHLAGPVLGAATEEQAREEVTQLAELNPDWAKIRVDDFLGRGEKMPESVYAEIISAAHDNGLPLAAHMVYLEDAKRLVERGADLLAHSVRDEPVDDELIALMDEHGICLTPTLTREVSTYIYADRPDFFDDPFFLQHADESVLQELQDPEVQQNYTGEAADYYREQLPLAKQNMMALHDAGIGIALGTDSGPPARFQGYFEHMEMEMMQDAGMSAEEVLSAATDVAASCMNLDDVGSLEEGNRADFVVLSANPTEDIHNLREIEAVYISGQELE